MNFATLQGLTIPEGVVTQITDASGRVLWSAVNGPVVLEVAKITSDTYAGETTYTGEQFILLDIYPKTTNSTVDVTYGGLTKTLTFGGMNAKQVYFGTFNGVSDSVTTPDSGTLTIEGGYAAYGCGSYNTSNKSMGSRCACITDVKEFGNISDIPAYGFANCSVALEQLPETVEEIGDSAFKNCPNLTLSSLPIGIRYIRSFAFDGCTNLALTSLPSGLTSIGNYAFRGCTGLTSMTIPNSMTSIGDYLFSGCTGLTHVSLPNGITNIGSAAFQNCTGLTSVTIPNGVTSIADNLFNGCTGLTHISLPSGITSIGDSAFQGCTNLALTSLPSGVTSIGDSAFQGCANLALTSLPSGVTSIEASAFSGCTNLALTSLPSGVTSIGNYAFRYAMANGTKLDIGDSVVTIGNGAFYGIFNKTEIEHPIITIGCGIQEIGEAAFKISISNSEYILHILATTPPVIVVVNENGGYTDATFGHALDDEKTSFYMGPRNIVVPVGCGDVYKTDTSWSYYANIIMEAS